MVESLRHVCLHLRSLVAMEFPPVDVRRSWVETDFLFSEFAALIARLIAKNNKQEMDNLKWRIVMLEEAARKIYPPTEMKREVNVHLADCTTVSMNFSTKKKKRSGK